MVDMTDLSGIQAYAYVFGNGLRTLPNRQCTLILHVGLILQGCEKLKWSYGVNGKMIEQMQRK